MQNLRACVMSIVMASAVAACGGSDADTGPVSPAEAEGPCRAGCEYEAMCDPNTGVTVEACTADCVGDVSGGGIRQDAFEAITDCVIGQACTADDDVCLRQCAPTGAHERYEARCRDFIATCGVTAPAEIDSACETTPNGGDLGFFCIFTPAAIDAFAACFDSSTCETIEACFDAAATRFGL